MTLSVLLSACSGNKKTDVMFECPSPSGEKIATLYRISYDDNPIHHEMKFNIRKADREFEDSMASFSFKYGYDAIMHWQSDHAMTIEYPQDSALTHQETVIFGTSHRFNAEDAIMITYQQRPSSHGYFLVEQRCFNAPHQ
ncbi:MAG: hypothetical protein Q9M16_00960 [Mariprofundus sp.]|nr:hypothetical protein [Mariprofundus sp.]